MTTFSTRPTDGVILRDGTPWFPVGFYHVSHFPADDERRFRDMGTMAAKGFDSIATPLTPTNAETYLRRGANLGVNVLIEPNETDGDMLPLVAACKDKPGLMGFQVVDDVDALKPDKTPKYAPADVTALCQKVKAIAPNRLTYISAGLARLSLNYVSCADVFGMQSYPVPDEDVFSTARLLRTTVLEAAKFRRVVIANIQAFGWPGRKLPTPYELRQMTYGAVMAGCKGVMFYTFYDPNWSLLDHRDLWNECIRLARELRVLGPTLVGA